MDEVARVYEDSFWSERLILLQIVSDVSIDGTLISFSGKFLLLKITAVICHASLVTNWQIAPSLTFLLAIDHELDIAIVLNRFLTLHCQTHRLYVVIAGLSNFAGLSDLKVRHSIVAKIPELSGLVR